MTPEKSPKRITELEAMAKEFILGYKPLTEQQKKLLEIIQRLQDRLNKLRKEETRITKLIDIINLKFAEFEDGNK